MEAARDAHAICVLTEWDQFKSYDYQAIYDSMVKPAFIFDGRNILDHTKLRWVGGWQCMKCRQTERHHRLSPIAPAGISASSCTRSASRWTPSCRSSMASLLPCVLRAVQHAAGQSIVAGCQCVPMGLTRAGLLFLVQTDRPSTPN